MTTEEIICRMIEYSKGNKHDIAHFMKVWGYAHTIGMMEQLDEHTQQILEAAAVVHDIACPYCREKFGNASGKLQEENSEPLLREFFKDTGIDSGDLERIIWLVSHHHTYTGVDGQDYRILLEADYLVNADEGKQSIEAVRNFRERVFRTTAGTGLLDSIYLKENL